MTGTSSRTTTAYGDGKTRHSAARYSATPRGCVGRKLQAKLRSEVHEVHMRQSQGGQGRVVVRSPKVIRTRGCICNGYVERRSRVLPREISPSVCETGSERGLGTAVKEGPAGRGRVYSTQEQTTHAARSGEQTREAARSTKGGLKSAESASCLRTAT
jgi:hypothetical protein